jgi:pectin methylesterase-like acyl-CoA thioesterase
VQAAIDAVRPRSGPATIVISPGTYTGQVYVPPDKPGLTLLGVPGHPADVVATRPGGPVDAGVMRWVPSTMKGC